MDPYWQIAAGVCAVLVAAALYFLLAAIADRREQRRRAIHDATVEHVAHYYGNLMRLTAATRWREELDEPVPEPPPAKRLPPPEPLPATWTEYRGGR